MVFISYDNTKDLHHQLGEVTYHMSPGGNDTYICAISGLSATQKARVNDFLLSGSAGVLEQGGFMEQVTLKGAHARLQMAGGEFCANATRAFATLLAIDYFDNKRFSALVDYASFQFDPKSQEVRFSLEVSGVSSCMQAMVKLGDAYVAQIDLPMPAGDVPVQARKLRQGQSHVVSLEGITHILVDEAILPFDQGSWRDVASEVLEQCADIDAPAVGVIWYSKKDGFVKMNPVVFVRSTGTFYYETSCGSGAIALVLHLTESGEELTVIPPSEIPLIVQVSDSCDGSNRSVRLLGEVNLIGTCNHRQASLA